ncbi:hypothetical protein APHAL10511_005360 [Amanita phalloides]|nr:hypothetical protein APHAL10511_005360 [Amanita phalloides]
MLTVPASFTAAQRVTEAFGDTKEQLAYLPDGANLGHSCGDPVAIASLREGEHVLDLGSGGGINVFLAASKVGPTGQVVGLDASPNMISLSRQNSASRNLKPPHVSFTQCPLTETLPVISDSVDCILSNCITNPLLASGAAHLFKEAYRVLRVGGRLAVSDIIAKAALPDDIRNDLSAHISCIPRTVALEEYKQFLSEAGFHEISFVATEPDLNMHSQNGINAQQTSGQLVAVIACSSDGSAKPSYNVNEYVASYLIRAVKPGKPVAEKAVNVLRHWWDAYPGVESAPPHQLTPDDVAGLIRASGTDYAVIDVRGNDHMGGHVRGSYQRAAQTFYDDLPRFFDQFRDTEKVIFYCGSSRGRGPRCAGWYQDYLDGTGFEHKSKAYVLQGGAKEWLLRFKGQDELVDYDEMTVSMF